MSAISTLSRQVASSEGEYNMLLPIRNAIFRRAICDWENSPDHAKAYVLEHYAGYSPAKRAEELKTARLIHASWVLAAEVYDFFNTPYTYRGRQYSPWADAYLVDVPYTGSEIWEMYLTGSWNRGGILDKPYKPPINLYDEEARAVVESYRNKELRLNFLFPERKKKKKGEKQNDKEDANCQNERRAMAKRTQDDDRRERGGGNRGS